jgi:integrase/recombinase XerC
MFLAEGDLSETTIKRYRRALHLILDDGIDLKDLSVKVFREWLKERGWSGSTQWLAYNAIRGFIRWQFGEEHPVLAMKLKRHKTPPQRSLDFDATRKLLYSFDTSTVKGRRDLAICCLFLDSGLRVSEMCRLELKYLDLDHLLLSVIVKGGDWKTKTYSPLTATYISTWLADRFEIAKPDVNTVFVSVGGNIPGRPLTRHGLQTIVRYWGRESGIGLLSPHDLRRTFATLSTEEGAPERVLMDQGGWSDSDMIKRYTQHLRLKKYLKYSPVMAAMR